MSDQPFPPVDITARWGRLNEDIIALVDYVPEDKMDWSPREGLWNFRGILLHIASGRDYWMGRIVKDGDPAPSVYETARSGAEIQREFRRSWERVQRFLADPANLSTEYEGSDDKGVWRLSGHWIAFHLLEHDVHHRADILHYLALLGVEHPEVGTP